MLSLGRFGDVLELLRLSRCLRLSLRSFGLSRRRKVNLDNFVWWEGNNDDYGKREGLRDGDTGRRRA